MLEIKGKNIYISGGSRGIGRALAIESAVNGANVFIAARDNQKLTDLSREISEKFGVKSSYSFCDVSDKNSVMESINQALAFLSKIDIAILNAGIGGSEKIAEFDSNNLQKIFEVNVFGIAHALEFLIPGMKENGSGIIAGISSMADVRGFPGSASYSSSKSALSMLLESARIEMKRYNVDVLTVRPGFVKTDMTDQNDFEMPFLMQPEKAAKIIMDGIRKKKRIIAFPKQMALLTGLVKIIPSWIFEPALKNWDKNARKKK